MKQRLRLALLAMVCIVLLSGCKCQHEWVVADCVTPKTCSLCQETEGAALGHDWLAATCEEAKSCKVCGVAEGVAAGHSWVEATCMAPKHCENCDLTEGAVLEHTWLAATTESPKTCSVCAATEGDRIITDERFKTEKCKAVFGTWEFEQTISGTELNLGDYVEEVPVIMVVNFTEDGRATRDVVFKDVDQFVQDLHAGTVEAIYRQFESQEMTREEADAAFMDVRGMSVEDYSTAVWAVVNWNAYFDLQKIEHVYYVDGEHIYLADAWDEPFQTTSYSISGDKMTWMGSDLSGGTVLELTRVQ